MAYSQPWERARPVHKPPATRPATPSGDPDAPVPGGAAPVDAAPVDAAPVEAAPVRAAPVPTNRARRRSKREPDLVTPPGTPLTRPVVAALGDDGWRATAETVDRLLGHDRARLRSALDRRPADLADARLRAAIPLARTLLDDVTTILTEVGRRSTGATAGGAPPVPPAGALRIARDFPWPDLLQRYGRTNDAGCVAAAYGLQDALAGLRPADLGEAHAQLAADLRRVRRALRDADRTDRPLSGARLRRLLTAVLRVVETVSIGLLAAAATAIEKGTGVATAAFTAAVGLVVSASCEQAVKLVREHRTPPSPAARFATAHEELDLLTGDLLQLLADEADEQLVTDTRTAALAQAHHARRLAGTVEWTRGTAYVEAVDVLVPALTADADTLRDAADALGAFRLPRG